jgi:hypothetical protein
MFTIIPSFRSLSPIKFHSSGLLKPELRIEMGQVGLKSVQGMAATMFDGVNDGMRTSALRTSIVKDVLNIALRTYRYSASTIVTDVELVSGNLFRLER